MTIRLTKNALEESSVRLRRTMRWAALTIRREMDFSADLIHRLGRKAESPSDEYLMELFLASSARSFATYSSEWISSVDVIMVFPS